MQCPNALPTGARCRRVSEGAGFCQPGCPGTRRACKTGNPTLSIVNIYLRLCFLSLEHHSSVDAWSVSFVFARHLSMKFDRRAFTISPRSNVRLVPVVRSDAAILVAILTNQRRPLKSLHGEWVLSLILDTFIETRCHIPVVLFKPWLVSSCRTSWFSIAGVFYFVNERYRDSFKSDRFRRSCNCCLLSLFFSFREEFAPGKFAVKSGGTRLNPD